MTEPLIREAAENDTAIFIELAAATFSEAFLPHSKPADIELYNAESFNDDVIRSQLRSPDYRTYIAFQNGRAVGYSQIRIGATAVIDAPHQVELKRLYLRAEYKGTGIAAKLFENVMEAAESFGARVVWLSVWEINERAIGFYKKHGFRKVGEQIFHVGTDSQRDWVMSKEL